MHHLIALAFVALLSGAPLAAQGGLQAAPSTRATAEVVLTTPGAVGGAGAAPRIIRVDYGQPHLRGRTLHTDSLVPWGQPWRLGANAPTTFRTDVPLTLGGVALAPGSYVLEALPERGALWWLLVRRPTGQRDADGNDLLQDVGRVPLAHRALPAPVESLSISLVPSRDAGPARGVFRVAWGRSELSAVWEVGRDG